MAMGNAKHATPSTICHAYEWVYVCAFAQRRVVEGAEDQARADTAMRGAMAQWTSTRVRV